MVQICVCVKGEECELLVIQPFWLVRLFCSGIIVGWIRMLSVAATIQTSKSIWHMRYLHMRHTSIIARVTGRLYQCGPYMNICGSIYKFLVVLAIERARVILGWDLDSCWRGLPTIFYIYHHSKVISHIYIHKYTEVGQKFWRVVYYACWPCKNKEDMMTL